MEFVLVTIVCVLLAIAVVWRVDEAEKAQGDGKMRFVHDRSLPRRIAHSSDAHWRTNPGAYDFDKQVANWDSKVEISQPPDEDLYNLKRLYKPVEETEWGLFWNPIPDPTNSSRPVFFNEAPTESGLRARIVETGMSGPNPMCGRGGYAGL